ncbi:SusC/RagA family TonB-linked outer membrane protein [Flavobacterium agrisoli]|uniref:SusC/RagA family TonB-linked outer membrane protein n=1 Tax=Flavobacterium agrisoli TaxID=2793066 RepID=A0A934PMY2_9FLAO|nr:SusC/RagA family TonB-linked outer membrane protein [Flavobacterium agrisoli]MBK0370462.1 SusC/RagA family TonB-linked outer membrane protein [Flavobacterium agrisoli]
MRLKFKWIFSLLVALSLQLVSAQEKMIKGVVSDETGPIPGVNVIVKGTKISSQTDFDGTYTINAKQGETLVFSYVGKNNLSMVVGSSSTINVQLTSDSNEMDEVVVVAYGKTTKSANTGSVASISSEKLQDRALTNVLSGLDGATSGVQIQTSSGQPGSAPSVRIRGFSSINGSNTPLYIVDGVPYTGDISAINSADVESMSILKDAASTSLYGSKAANGVVIITTKIGKSEVPKFTLNVSQGLSSRSIPEYSRVNASQYYPLEWEAIRNSRPMGTQAQLDAANLYATNNVATLLVVNPFNVQNNQIVGVDGKLNPNAELLYADDLDWEKQLSRTGIRRSSDFSYQGRSETSNYFVSISNLKDEGVIQNSDYERTTARVNINSKFKEWFRTGLNLSGALSDSNQAVNGVDNTSSFNNPFRTIRYMGPIYPVFDHNADGSFMLDGAGEKIYSTVRGAQASTGRNIVYETLNNKDIDKTIVLSARTFAEFKLLKDIKFTANYAIDKTSINNSTYTNKLIGDAAGIGGASKSDYVYTGVTFNQLLEYEKAFGSHNLSVLAGHESFDYETTYLTGTKRGQVVNDNTEFINFVTVTNLDSYSRNYSTESYFSRLGYDYEGKYILSASFRRDGSSKFAKENRWGNFWSVGAAWNISKESFLSSSSWLNDLKLRGSFGEVGNDSHTSNSGLSYYVYQPTYSLGYDNGSEGGIVANGIGAPNLKWEKNTQADLALEFSTFSNRFSGTVEYYNRKTDGLIFNVPNPLSLGLDNRVENIGSMENDGIEVSLNAMFVKTKDFSWDFNVNASTINNKITSLPQEEIINGSKKLKVGSSMYDYWLRDWYGVDPTDGYILYVSDPSLIVANDAEQRVVNGVNVTTNHTKALYHYAGSSLPDLYGSFTNTFKYAGLELSVMFTYQLGGLTYDTNYASLMHSGNQYGSALSTDILNRWQNPGDITDVPRLDVNRETQNSAASDRWLIDSDYLSFRQANLAYNLPNNLTDKLGINSMRFFVNGENLILFTKKKGMDPTQNFNGTTQNRFSPSRVISLGLNLNF